jgi:hypothetical protein
MLPPSINESKGGCAVTYQKIQNDDAEYPHSQNFSSVFRKFFLLQNLVHQIVPSIELFGASRRLYKSKPIAIQPTWSSTISSAQTTMICFNTEEQPWLLSGSLSLPTT